VGNDCLFNAGFCKLFSVFKLGHFVFVRLVFVLCSFLVVGSLGVIVSVIDCLEDFQNINDGRV